MVKIWVLAGIAIPSMGFTPLRQQAWWEMPDAARTPFPMQKDQRAESSLRMNIGFDKVLNLWKQNGRSNGGDDDAAYTQPPNQVPPPARDTASELMRDFRLVTVGSKDPLPGGPKRRSQQASESEVSSRSYLNPMGVAQMEPPKQPMNDRPLRPVPPPIRLDTGGSHMFRSTSGASLYPHEQRRDLVDTRLLGGPGLRPVGLVVGGSHMNPRRTQAVSSTEPLRPSAQPAAPRIFARPIRKTPPPPAVELSLGGFRRDGWSAAGARIQPPPPRTPEAKPLAEKVTNPALTGPVINDTHPSYDDHPTPYYDEQEQGAHDEEAPYSRNQDMADQRVTDPSSKEEFNSQSEKVSSSRRQQMLNLWNEGVPEAKDQPVSSRSPIMVDSGSQVEAISMKQNLANARKQQVLKLWNQNVSPEVELDVRSQPKQGSPPRSSTSYSPPLGPTVATGDQVANGKSYTDAVTGSGGTTKPAPYGPSTAVAKESPLIGVSGGDHPAPQTVTAPTPAAPAPVPSTSQSPSTPSFVPPVPATSGKSYMDALSGSVGTMKPASYGPAKKVTAPATETVNLAGPDFEDAPVSSGSQPVFNPQPVVAPPAPAPVVVPVPSSPSLSTTPFYATRAPAPSGKSYMDAISGPGGTMKPASYGPADSFKPSTAAKKGSYWPAKNGYHQASSTPPVIVTPAPVVAPIVTPYPAPAYAPPSPSANEVSYMDDLSGSKGAAKPASYWPAKSARQPPTSHPAPSEYVGATKPASYWPGSRPTQPAPYPSRTYAAAPPAPGPAVVPDVIENFPSTEEDNDWVVSAQPKSFFPQTTPLTVNDVPTKPFSPADALHTPPSASPFSYVSGSAYVSGSEATRKPKSYWPGSGGRRETYSPPSPPPSTRYAAPAPPPAEGSYMDATVISHERKESPSGDTSSWEPPAPVPVSNVQYEYSTSPPAPADVSASNDSEPEPDPVYADIIASEENDYSSYNTAETFTPGRPPKSYAPFSPKTVSWKKRDDYLPW